MYSVYKGLFFFTENSHLFQTKTRKLGVLITNHNTEVVGYETKTIRKCEISAQTDCVIIQVFYLLGTVINTMDVQPGTMRN